ncbi:MAG: endonuclease domain-containing protein [Acidimicrobiia bacterium]|nr:endonuclease domain-containing protein [Acidimicrobiia bacterium]
MNLAAQRAGVCLRFELLAAGVTRSSLGRRIEAGVLRPTVRGVYVVDGLAGERTPLHHAIVALPEAELSRFTAGRLQDFALDPAIDAATVHVAVPHGTNRRIDGVSIHRRRRPSASHDLVIIDGLPVTGPALTIVDLAAVVGPSRLRYLVQTQVRDQRPSLDEVIACFNSVARRGVNGIGPLRKVLRTMTDGEPVPDSALERATAMLLIEHGIDGFQPQYRPPWYDGIRGIVDFAHPELRIVLEADGRRWHRRDQDMTDDRRRDRLAARHGWTMIRVTWHEVTVRPAATADDVRAIAAERQRLLEIAA